MMNKAAIWLQAARGKTLTAAIVPVVAAAALSYRTHGTGATWIFWCTLLCALCIQIGTNFINDALDFRKGADTSTRVGPQRVTQAGLITDTELLLGAKLVLAIALLLGIPLVIHGGIPILIIGLFSLFFAWGYTGGPFPLAYRGLGEVFVVIFFGLAAVCGTYYLLTLSVTKYAFLLGAQIGLFATALIAINNLRDINGDRQAGKKTVAVVFGERFARVEIAALCLAPFALGILWQPLDTAIGLWPLVVLPLAGLVTVKMQTLAPSASFNRYLGLAALLHLSFGLLISVALLWV